MKKYSITTTVNGKALVKQEHTFGTDGCTTSYGDVWCFDSCAEAGKWVDSELGIVSNAQPMGAQKESGQTLWNYKIPSDEIQQDRCDHKIFESFMDKTKIEKWRAVYNEITKDEKTSNEAIPFIKNLGIDKDQLSGVDPDAVKELLDKDAKNE